MLNGAMIVDAEEYLLNTPKTKISLNGCNGCFDITVDLKMS